MRPLQTDLSIFEKFNFARPPVGIKFLFFKPEGIEQYPVDKDISFCEFITEGHKAAAPFYFARDNTETCVGKFLLGMEDVIPAAESGQVGERFEIFQEARANYRLYQHVPMIQKGVANYVAVAPMDQLIFDPDVFIITATTQQSGVIMRAMTYSTGELLTSKATHVMGCAWTFIYPYQTGKVNFVIPDMFHGMHARQLFDSSTVLISIPYQWLPVIARNLEEMKPSHMTREGFLEDFGNTVGQLIKDAQNP